MFFDDLIGLLVLIVFAQAVASAGFCRWLAARKGYETDIWLILGFFFGVLAILALGFAPQHSEVISPKPAAPPPPREAPSPGPTPPPPHRSLWPFFTVFTVLVPLIVAVAVLAWQGQRQLNGLDRTITAQSDALVKQVTALEQLKQRTEKQLGVLETDLKAVRSALDVARIRVPQYTFGADANVSDSDVVRLRGYVVQWLLDNCAGNRPGQEANFTHYQLAGFTKYQVRKIGDGIWTFTSGSETWDITETPTLQVRNAHGNSWCLR